MTLYGKRELVFQFVTLIFIEFLNKSLRKIGKKSHIHNKHKPTGFRVQTERLTAGVDFFAVRGKNKHSKR